MMLYVVFEGGEAAPYAGLERFIRYMVSIGVGVQYLSIRYVPTFKLCKYEETIDSYTYHVCECHLANSLLVLSSLGVKTDARYSI
jgi:hypothetical protein